MTYFVKKDNIKKASSPADEVFSIFLTINNSSDEMDMYDDIIRSIKKYRRRDFIEDDVELLTIVSDMIFGTPNVPENVNKVEKPPTPTPKNKFSARYPI